MENTDLLGFFVEVKSKPLNKISFRKIIMLAKVSRWSAQININVPVLHMSRVYVATHGMLVSF